ncbi:peptidylprolyl isomerase [Shewanella chilikensis]|uniref:Peptidyl-prolyl cis-trans isomerase n=1 Tax=Shewanella chilikensis TaxID=558541 RepID=A0ABX5PJS4_9GAMM|nr:FKBP-type peptidyl-prolyl cis-trans isomerase [Shewanella chilikensis]MCL1155630.1 FKBP-type peptidyl-prolyl cis-trans isomerase [Shewanella chilikensis]PYE56151.1 peptidylprolyl isomerase [Shewanella chilikensis]GGZ39950.1 peptidyl-prolyl cis-trans isomerase [Shewanella chilikensis]
MRMLLAVVVIAAVIFYFFTTMNGQKLAKENVAKGEVFLEANKHKEGVVTTDSGLQYQLLHKGQGQVHPGPKDKVTVHYHGTLIDGTVFDSSVDRGEPIAFPLNQVIKGWTEGVQLMTEGDKMRFFIPSSLGYGNRSAGSIPPGSVLIFNVELLKIN